MREREPSNFEIAKENIPIKEGGYREAGAQQGRRGVKPKGVLHPEQRYNTPDYDSELAVVRNDPGKKFVPIEEVSPNEEVWQEVGKSPTSDDVGELEGGSLLPDSNNEVVKVPDDTPQVVELGEGKIEAASHLGDTLLVQKKEAAAKSDGSGRLLGSSGRMTESMSPTRVVGSHEMTRADIRPSIEKFSHSKEKKMSQRRVARQQE